MAATAAIVLRLVFRTLVTHMIGATVNATSAVLPRSAIGMEAIAAIVPSIALRVLAARLLLHGAMVGATEIATRAASTRSATGTTAIAAISLKLAI